MIGGTSEDDFADAVVHVKERNTLWRNIFIGQVWTLGERYLCSF